MPFAFLALAVLAVPRHLLAVQVPSRLAPRPNTSEREQFVGRGVDAQDAEDEAWVGARNGTGKKLAPKPLALVSMSTEAASSDTGGDVELKFSNALPVGKVQCLLSNSAGGFELSLEPDWSITAYRKGDNSVVCALPPSPGGAEGPMDLMVYVGKYQMLASPKKVSYLTPLAVSFSETPYFGADTGELLVRTSVSNPQGILHLTAKIGDEILVKQEIGASVQEVVAVPLQSLPASMSRPVDIELSDLDGRVRLAVRALRLVRVADKKRGRSGVDHKRRTITVDGHPFFSIAWFSTYLSFGLDRTLRSLRDMSRRGVNSLMMYNLLEGTQQDPLASPTSDNPDADAVMDAAGAMGIKMHVCLLEVTRKLASGLTSNYTLLDQIVTKWRDHPALLSWYVADDDAGPFLPEVYARIKTLDPYHLVTMAIAGVGHAFEHRFIHGSDVIMVENYPRDAMGAYTNMDTLNHWPLEFMPSLTCGRAWAIAEDGALVTPELFRAQLYTALAAKTTGEIWFAYRNAGGWNEPGVPLEEAGGMAARELYDLASALISKRSWDAKSTSPKITTTAKTLPPRQLYESPVVARALVEDSGCISLIVANTLMEPVEATVKFAYGTEGIFDKITTKTDALVAFELGEKMRRVPITMGRIVEWLPSLGVQVFRINGTSDGLAIPTFNAGNGDRQNLIHNPSFEEFGAYISDPVFWQCGMSPNGGNGSACFADTHVKVDGRHAGRFVTGTDVEAFHVHPELDILYNGTYEGSFWAMSDKPFMKLSIGRSDKFVRGYLRNKAPVNYEEVTSLVLTDDWQEVKFELPMWKQTQLTIKANDTGVFWLDKADLRLKRLQKLQQKHHKAMSRD